MSLEEYYGDMIVDLVEEHQPISHEDLFGKFCYREDDDDIEKNYIVLNNFNDFIDKQIEQNNIKRTSHNQLYVYSKTN